MSVATDNNPASPAQGAEHSRRPGALERALEAAIRDTDRIGELLDTLRTARLWLPLPADGPRIGPDGAVTLPTVTYLGGDFVPAYTSADLLAQLACLLDPAAADPAAMPHLAVKAADLARLLPPGVGIALNAGAPQSVPIYPQGVAFLAADDKPADMSRISVGPLPEQPDDLFARIAAGLTGIPQASRADAAWLSVRFRGEGLLVSVTLDDPGDAAVRETVVTALEQAAALTRQDGGYPIDVTFAGEAEADYIDRWIAAFGTRFYERAS